jgi:putative transposase
MPLRSYQYRLAKHQAGDPPKGPWPAPVVDRIEPQVAKLAGEWPAWGHRKIWAMGRYDGYQLGSQSSVARAMGRRDLLQPGNYQAERRQLAAARRAVFVDPPQRRNRVWQADFTEFETQRSGTWRLCPVVDYHSKLVLSCTLTATQTASDLCAAFDAAIDSAELLLGHELALDCVNVETGEIEPLVIVTDNGPAMKSIAIARWFKARDSWLRHVRTKHRSPHTNGVVERWNQSLKYERLYRHEIADVIDLEEHIDDYLLEYNQQRPHEAIDWQRPLDRHLDPPNH